MTRPVFDPNWIVVALAVVGILLGAYASYNANDKKLSIDVATVQAQEQSTNARLDRIENKLDSLIWYFTGERPITPASK